MLSYYSATVQRDTLGDKALPLSTQRPQAVDGETKGFVSLASGRESGEYQESSASHVLFPEWSGLASGQYIAVYSHA